MRTTVKSLRNQELVETRYAVNLKSALYTYCSTRKPKKTSTSTPRLHPKLPLQVPIHLILSLPPSPRTARTAMSDQQQVPNSYQADSNKHSVHLLPFACSQKRCYQKACRAKSDLWRSFAQSFFEHALAHQADQLAHRMDCPWHHSFRNSFASVACCEKVVEVAIFRWKSLVWPCLASKMGKAAGGMLVMCRIGDCSSSVAAMVMGSRERMAKK